jgi:hypothetical protein
MVLPVLRAFFYTRPIGLAPSGDGFFIAFTSPFFGFLTTPAHPSKDVPNTGRVVGYSEVFFDHFGDPSKRPQFSSVTVFASAFQQQLLQAIHLLFRQTGSSSRRTMRLKKGLALLFIGLTPLRYGSGSYANQPSGLVYAMSPVEQSNGFSSPIL